MIQVGLLGFRGRMGQWVSRVIETERSGEAAVAVRIGNGDPMESLFSTDVVIDFSSPAGMIELARKGLERAGRNLPLPAFVIGSTGWQSGDRGTLEALSFKAPVLMSSNFSTGVMAFMDIVQDLSEILGKLGYTAAIVETHHRHKKDSPSGTALSIQKILKGKLPEPAQIHSIRAGEVCGEHEVVFHGLADLISIRHSARDRSIFARGAVDAALWLAKNRHLWTGGGIMGTETYFRQLKDQNHV